MKYVHLDDQAIKIGGTNLTSLAIFESRISDIVSVSCQELTVDFIARHSDKMWILGNIVGLANLPISTIDFLFESVSFVKIEFDYNYCPYRGNLPHKINGKEECDCPHGNGHPALSRIYQHIPEKAKWIFYMSERQRCIHVTHMPNIRIEETSILSSCFTVATIQKLRLIKESNKPKNGKYAILSGFGGWHSKAKGLQEAINYCSANKLPYDVLPVMDYEEHINRLSEYVGLVFLPIIEDTCPRCIIEAEMMGLEVITNSNSQHVTEKWWRDNTVTEYISSRPSYFWGMIDVICSTSVL